MLIVVATVDVVDCLPLRFSLKDFRSLLFCKSAFSFSASSLSICPVFGSAASRVISCYLPKELLASADRQMSRASLELGSSVGSFLVVFRRSCRHLSFLEPAIIIMEVTARRDYQEPCSRSTRALLLHCAFAAPPAHSETTVANVSSRAQRSC